jgi:hypothetical protein
LAVSYHELNKDEEVIRVIKEVDNQYSQELKTRIVNQLTNQPGDDDEEYGYDLD